MKTAELTGAALDWAVSKAEGYFDIDMASVRDGVVDVFYFESYTPSTDWAQGGPIIEREKINTTMSATAPWMAFIYDGLEMTWMVDGKTPLVAAMRCYVASKLGEEVQIPDELN